MAKFNTKEEYRKWLESEEWYQSIVLPSGLKTHGKVATDKRLEFLGKIDFKDKSVLDIGCNSGQYALLAKEKGATRVAGVDIDTQRIKQAETLSENEGLEVAFETKSLFEIEESRFDIVLCIAVLTEIQDFFGAIEKLKRLIGEKGYIELELAKPLIYFSSSKYWLQGYPGIPRQKALAELRETHGGKLIFSPTMEVLKHVFGPEFSLKHLPGGVRYDLVEVVRRK